MLSTFAKKSALSQVRNFGHVVASSPSQSIGDEKPVPVYTASEFDDFKAISGEGFTSAVCSSPVKGKFFSLLPFQMESRFYAKHFVLKMELFPKSAYMKMHVLKFSGVEEIFVPVQMVVPITPYDYWSAHPMFFTKQNLCIDLEMIYANHNSKDMYVFDKMGTWHEEGVEHEKLTLEKTFNETNWYDEFNVLGF